MGAPPGAVLEAAGLRPEGLALIPWRHQLWTATVGDRPAVLHRYPAWRWPRDVDWEHSSSGAWPPPASPPRGPWTRSLARAGSPRAGGLGPGELPAGPHAGVVSTPRPRGGGRPPGPLPRRVGRGAHGRSPALARPAGAAGGGGRRRPRGPAPGGARRGGGRALVPAARGARAGQAHRAGARRRPPAGHPRRPDRQQRHRRRRPAGGRRPDRLRLGLPRAAVADVGFGLWRSGRAEAAAVAADPARVRRLVAGYHGVRPLDARAGPAAVCAYMRARGLQFIVHHLDGGGERRLASGGWRRSRPTNPRWRRRSPRRSRPEARRAARSRARHRRAHAGGAGAPGCDRPLPAASTTRRGAAAEPADPAGAVAHPEPGYAAGYAVAPAMGRPVPGGLVPREGLEPSPHRLEGGAPAPPHARVLIW